MPNKPTKTSRRNERAIFALGNEAVVKGALLAGCSFYAGYPITPSTEIAEIMADRLPRREGGVFIQMEDEIASLGAVIGASLAGRWLSRKVKRVNNGRANVRTLNRVDGQIITPSQIFKLLQKV